MKKETQEEMAKALEVTQATVSNWLRGANKPVGRNKKHLQKSYPELYKEIFPHAE